MLHWDGEADVVIVGFGGAGCAAAIEAHDAGVSTLIVEKQSSEYHVMRTDTAMSGGNFMVATDVEAARLYIERCNGGLVCSDLLRAWAKEAAKTPEWFERVTPGLEFKGQKSIPEHQDFPGAEGVFAHRPVRRGIEFFAALVEAVRSRRVEVRYDTPAKELVLGADREVQGVIVESAGRRSAIKARRAVILTCGSFSADEEMKRNFLPMYPFYTYGSPYNAGDGVRMAMQAGADLWGMNLSGSRGVAWFPGLAFGFCLALNPPPYLVVDKHGNRFMNEEHQAANRHDVAYTLTVYDAKRGEYPRIPCYWIFDETRRQAGPLDVDFGIRAARLYEWSEDNIPEIEKGWIIKADTVGELGAKLGLEHLDESWNTYERYCHAGKDHDFDRNPATLIPLDHPPYYAVALFPGGSNVIGGPKRNEKSQVLDVYGRPVPRLYAAGELGMPPMRLSVCPGSALSSTICFGRIAGLCAAAEEPRS